MKLKILSFIAILFLSITVAFPEPYWYKSQLQTGVYGNCGPTCVAMMVYFAFPWQNVSVQDIRSDIGLTRPDGATDIDELEKVLKIYGVSFFDTNLYTTDDIDYFVSRVGYKLIVLVDLDEIPSKANRGRGLGGHYFIIDGVVSGVAGKEDYYIVQDPFDGADVMFSKRVVKKSLVTNRMIAVSFDAKKSVDKWNRFHSQK